MTDHPITLSGAYGSPYTMKMRAVLRYRRIPFRWVLRNSRWDDLPAPPVPIIPVIVFPADDGSYGEVMVDSSPLIVELEARFRGRSVIPPDPALAFIDHLLEDYADEWVTKMMYHYRWAYDADIDKAGNLLPLQRDLQLSDDALAGAREFIIDRQVGRRALVGSSDANRPAIEGSYERLLDLLDRQLAANDFLVGERPARGDFALYGQLVQLLKWDPTSMAIGTARAPRLVTWIDRMDDLSWWEVDGDDGWFPTDGLPPTTHELLTEAGSTYVPFLLANAEALAEGRDEVVCEIRGQEYRQGPFKYQGKCLTWLREAYGALDDGSRSTVDGLLDGTGCERLVA